MVIVSLMAAGFTSFLVHAQDMETPFKKTVEDNFYKYKQHNNVSSENAYFEVLTDSLGIIKCNFTGYNGRGQKVTLPTIFYTIVTPDGVLSHSYQTVSFGLENPFSDLNPYFARDEMGKEKHRNSFYGKKTYEDAMYYRCLYHLALNEMYFGTQIDEKWLKSLKTGFWFCKNELDTFGDSKGVSLSCPFYAKRIEGGDVVKENIACFLSISAESIRFILPKLTEFINPYRNHYVSIKDASGNQQTWTLDKDLNITSNALTFLRAIQRNGIIKGTIVVEGEKSYTFSIYSYGFNAAKKAANLSTKALSR